jgi:hypothetical protein
VFSPKAQAKQPGRQGTAMSHHQVYDKNLFRQSGVFLLQLCNNFGGFVTLP